MFLIILISCSLFLIWLFSCASSTSIWSLTAWSFRRCEAGVCVNWRSEEGCEWRVAGGAVVAGGRLSSEFSSELSSDQCVELSDCGGKANRTRLVNEAKINRPTRTYFLLQSLRKQILYQHDPTDKRCKCNSIQGFSSHLSIVCEWRLI